MFLLLIIIFTFSVIAMIYLVKEDSYSNYVWTAFVMNLLIFIIAAAVMIHLIGHKYEGSKITDKSTNTKDSVIVKDSLLILNTNDTVRVFNINKL